MSHKMTERAFFAAIAFVTLVASNPVPQGFPSQQYESQQIPYRIPSPIPTTNQADTSQTSPYTQHATVQNAAPTQGNADGTMNQLLMTKILRNPCLQKILNPNTKLYNQNGQEILRQPNTSGAPSVVNNYFIVPPEFFNLTANKTEEKPKNVPRKRKNGGRKANLTKNKTKLNISEDKEENNVTNDNKKKNKPNNSDHVQKRKKKKKKNRKAPEVTEEKLEIDIEQDTKEPKPEMKITKKRKKQESLTKTKPMVEISSPNDDPIVNINEDELDRVPVQNNTRKRRKKVIKESNASKTETTDHIPTPEIVVPQETVRPKSKKIKSASESKSKNSEIVPEPDYESHLKNIESPVDNSETNNLKENNRPTKSAKENRKTKNPNTDKVKNEPKETNKPAQSITPISDDMLKNFFPYMYMGNNFYSNGNYPFNFEQFYQPYVNNNSNNNNSNSNNRKNNKTRKNQDEQNKKGSPPNVYEVKLKPKKSKNTTTTTTIKPINEENTDKAKIDSTNTTKTVKLTDEKNTDTIKFEPVTISPTAVSDKSNTKMPVEEPKNEKPPKTTKSEEPEINPEPESKKQETVLTKANLKMPPTVFEDIHEYITPDLGNEDIVPTIHTNGITNDYYPTFYDDPQYENDESYYLRDLEDDRHFYTTDRGFEEPLNRDRSKYDRHEDHSRLNLDIKDHINFRRTYKFREKENAKFDDYDKSHVRRPFPEKIIEKDKPKTYFNSEKEDAEDHMVEDQFQTPPLLENPDFITKKIEKFYPKSEVDTFGSREPIYRDSVEVIDHKFYTDPKPIQFGRLVNYDETTNNENLSANKQKGDRIETVFAKTRVVKYGVAKEEQENTSTMKSQPLFENDSEEFHSDGHTTYVLAKSLGHSDDYFW